MFVDTKDPVLNEYCQYFSERLDAVPLREGSLSGLLTEAVFSGKSFDRMIDQLNKIEQMLPEEMEHSLNALRRAIDDAEKKYAKLIRRKITKEEFTKMVAQTKGLADGLARGISELQSVMKARKIKRRVNARLGYDSDGDGVGDTLGDVLDDNHKEILKARLELAFTKPEGMVGKLWKMLSPESYGWHGLTDEKLVSDVMSLTRDGLRSIFGVKSADVDDLFPEKVENALEDEAESMLPDEVANDEEALGTSSREVTKKSRRKDDEDSSPYELSLANTVTQGPARDREARPRHVSTVQDKINRARKEAGLKPFSYVEEPVQDLTSPEMEEKYIDYGEEEQQEQPSKGEDEFDDLERPVTIVPDESSAEPDTEEEAEKPKSISLKQFLKDYAGQAGQFNRKQLSGLVKTLRNRGFKVIDDLDEAKGRDNDKLILERWRCLAGLK